LNSQNSISVTDNGIGFELGFVLAFGSNYQGTNDLWTASSHYSTSSQVNWMDSTSNNFYLTGIQLELGSNATPFEHRSYAEELGRCQRYFIVHGVGKQAGSQDGTAYFSTTYELPVTMRTTPTLTVSGTIAFLDHDSYNPTSSYTPIANSMNGSMIQMQYSGLSGQTDNRLGGCKGTMNMLCAAEL